MKWVTFISFLFLASLAESKHLPRRYRHAGHQDTIAQATEVTADEFRGIALVLYSQVLQQATFEEVSKVMNDIVELQKKCVADEKSDPECTKPLGTVFVDEFCHEQEIIEKYGFSDCCAKADPDRQACILAHKNATQGFIPPFQKPSSEEGCKAFEADPRQTLGRYAYEIARRYPFSKTSTIFAGTAKYKAVLTTCCQEADKDACFAEKATEVSKYLRKDFARQKQICSVRRKLGELPLRALKVAQLSQKFPKADLPTVLKLSEDIVHAYAECCKGDTLECLLDRADVSKYICSHQATISSKVHDCCEKSLLEQGDCLAHAENDDKPADLSPTVREFIDNKEVCQHYADNQNLHKAKFVYEYSRRHPELSPELLVRLGKGYGDLLDKCCPLENTVECLGHGEEELKKHISDTVETMKKNCALHATTGDYLFQNEMLVLYTKRAPELTFDELYEYTKGLTKAASKCCNEDEAHKLPCAEKYVSFVLGEICRRHEEHHINKQVCKCCSDSLTFRRECFSSLGPDPEYVPIPFSPDLFTFNADLCTADAEVLKRKKQKQLVDLIKHKPTITDEQLASLIVDFQGMMTQCCEEAEHDTCFAKEGPKLIERTRAAFGEN
ncbi:alpha-fetoprotein-like [Zootoca vivipara]|uniref:alpha-fetoprotein-like n=1 Tax=Zootoca vivipara TaxID=8524 RepID=UPI001591DCEB|nr:alpha-fetoprotein-like [Zootoca vivipara]XP_060137520.1 alpha-fetoprotein-like [Zootoca vivipara]